jgi:hypothetical protein
MKSVFGFFAVAVIGSVASADVVSFQFAGVSRGNNVGISANGGSFHNVFAGSVIHNVDGQRTVTFCIDPDQWAQSGTTQFEREALADALSHRGGAQSKAWAIGEMAIAAGPDIWSETADKNLASAFQVAVWEVVMDLDAEIGVGSLNLAGGSFRAAGTNGSSLSSSVSTIVNQLFGSITFDPMKLGKFEAYTNASHQDFMTMVPAPGSMLLSLAALPLVAPRRRR